MARWRLFTESSIRSYKDETREQTDRPPTCRGDEFLLLEYRGRCLAAKHVRPFCRSRFNKYTSNFPILHKCLSLLFSHQARSMCFTCDDRTTQWLHRQEGENVSQAPPGTHENRGHRYLNISTAPTMSRTNQKSLF